MTNVILDGSPLLFANNHFICLSLLEWYDGWEKGRCEVNTSAEVESGESASTDTVGVWTCWRAFISHIYLSTFPHRPATSKLLKRTLGHDKAHSRNQHAESMLPPVLANCSYPTLSRRHHPSVSKENGYVGFYWPIWTGMAHSAQPRVEHLECSLGRCKGAYSFGPWTMSNWTLYSLPQQHGSNPGGLRVFSIFYGHLERNGTLRMEWVMTPLINTRNTKGPKKMIGCLREVMISLSTIRWDEIVVVTCTYMSQVNKIPCSTKFHGTM